MSASEFCEDVLNNLHENINSNIIDLGECYMMDFAKTECYKFEEDNCQNEFTSDKTPETNLSQSNQITFSEDLTTASENHLKINNLIFKIEKISLSEERNTTCSSNEILDVPRRKELPDDMRRKFKVHIFKYILNKLNLYRTLYALPEDRKFIKFSKELIETISIKYNKSLNEKTLGNILNEDRSISKKLKIFDDEHNKNLAEDLLSIEQFECLFNITVKELIEEFMTSSQFSNHLEKVKRKDGTNYYLKYYSIVTDYIFYYIRKDPNYVPPKSKKVKIK
jgi:hypothetical protein